jgi:hypothetical protein
MLSFKSYIQEITEGAPLEKSGFTQHKGMPKKSARKLAYALKKGEYSKALDRQTKKTGSHFRRIGNRLDRDTKDFMQRMGLAEVTEMHDEMSHSPVQGLIAHIEKRLVEFETAVKNPTPKDTVRSMDIRATKLDRMVGTLRDLKAEGASSKAYDFAKRLTQANARRGLR